MTRSLSLLMALVAVFFTSCAGEGDIPSWHEYDPDAEEAAESDDDASDDLPGGPSDDDASDDDDATDPDLPDGPSDDDDDATSDDDSDLPDGPDDDDVSDDDDSIPEPPADADGDGYTEDVDCDDSDPAIHPGAVEACNGLDDNCSSSLPENDVDLDEDGVLECAGDCNDADDDIYPGAPDTCDGVDSACNGIGNEADVDVDLYMVCENDCDDVDDEVNPGEAEVCGNGVDDDCSGTVDTNCPPDWCPTGSIIDLTLNTGFESAEPIEFFPTLSQHWGYGELLLSTPPARSCAGVAYNGGCSLQITGQPPSSEFGGAPWENQVRYLINLQGEGVAVGDAIHVELALRGADPGLSVGVELLENWNYTPMTTIVGAISAQAPMGNWNPVTLDGDVTSVSGTLRLELQYGNLDAGEVVYADDVTVEACLSP